MKNNECRFCTFLAMPKENIGMHAAACDRVVQFLFMMPPLTSWGSAGTCLSLARICLTSLVKNLATCICYQSVPESQ